MTVVKLKGKLNKSIRQDDWTSLFCLRTERGTLLSAVGPCQPLLAWLPIIRFAWEQDRVVRLRCGVPVDAEKIPVDTGGLSVLSAHIQRRPMQNKPLNACITANFAAPGRTDRLSKLVSQLVRLLGTEHPVFSVGIQPRPEILYRLTSRGTRQLYIRALKV
jgi:hypothetical protein